MTARTIKSPAYSLRGWKLKAWILGNGTTIKELLKVGVPAIIAWLITNNYLETGLATVLGKLILDTAEYYIKERR